MNVDPDGELLFLAVVAIWAAVFGTTNVAVQAANGEIDNFWDGLEAFGSGAVTGAAITAGVTTGLGVPVLGTVIKGTGVVYGGTLTVSTLSGLGDGIFNGDWDRLQNTGNYLQVTSIWMVSVISLDKHFRVLDDLVGIATIYY